MTSNVWGPAPGLTRAIIAVGATAIVVGLALGTHGVYRDKGARIVIGAVVFLAGALLLALELL